MKNASKNVALSGVTAALAVVIMCIGTLIPVATYVCPMICALLLQAVNQSCGKRLAWAWYGAVSLLSVLLSADKEAAAVFVFLGYYPILKPMLDRSRFSLVWKLLMFNCTSVILYAVLIYVFGMAYLAAEFREMGLIAGGLALLLANLTFFLLDRLLSMNFWYNRKR